MIGQNDIQGEWFTAACAVGLLSLASHARLSRAPAAQVQFNHETPWELFRPVPPEGPRARLCSGCGGDVPSVIAEAGAYGRGQVLFHEEPYQARWSNQGISPAAEAGDPSGSPWRPCSTSPPSQPADSVPVLGECCPRLSGLWRQQGVSSPERSNWLCHTQCVVGADELPRGEA